MISGGLLGWRRLKIAHTANATATRPTISTAIMPRINHSGGIGERGMGAATGVTVTNSAAGVGDNVTFKGPTICCVGGAATGVVPGKVGSTDGAVVGEGDDVGFLVGVAVGGFVGVPVGVGVGEGVVDVMVGVRVGEGVICVAAGMLVLVGVEVDIGVLVCADGEGDAVVASATTMSAFVA
jgi:hypothetical protein